MWTNSNSAEWVRGSTLALSDAISQSDLQSFMDTHAMKYLPLPGKPREAEVPSPGSKPSEPEPGSRMEVDLAEHAKKLQDGDGRSGVDESRIEEGVSNDGHGRTEDQIEVHAVALCVDGISATPAATPAGDTVMSEKGSSVVAGSSRRLRLRGVKGILLMWVRGRVRLGSGRKLDQLAKMRLGNRRRRKPKIRRVGERRHSPTSIFCRCFGKTNSTPTPTQFSLMSVRTFSSKYQ